MRRAVGLSALLAFLLLVPEAGHAQDYYNFNNCAHYCNTYARTNAQHSSCTNDCRERFLRAGSGSNSQPTYGGGRQQCEVLCGGGRCVRNCFR
jgi:hypothetical protein